MAISKQKKEQLVNQYVDWISNSQSFILTEYKGLAVKDLDELREKARDVGGEFHIIKNTLAAIAFKSEGLKVPEDTFTGTTAIAVAVDDAPGMAKVVADFSKDNEFLKVKCGYLEKELLSVAEITALAELPPLPVQRAILLGTLIAPASKLARTLSEPARQVTAVLQAFATQESAEAAS